ncbi:MAG: thiamine-phosphate kinase [Pseudomonadota bacterium]|nr:thiamine-phosphate kinase [Pseudomonadota bacterium]
MIRKKSDNESGEDRLIARYFKPFATHPGALALTDDAAFLTPPDGRDLVVTTDAVVAGIHFFPADPAAAVASKALRVNLSDLAAKGAEPAGFVMALGMPAIKPRWLEAFARQLAADARTYGCPLLGGDTVKTKGSLFVSITAIGTLPRRTMVKRSGAKAGDVVMVTGTLGDASLELHRRRKGSPKWKLSRAAARHLAQRYLYPEPRCGLALAVRRCASAAIDISDGLAGDLTKLCKVSGVSADIDIGKVPLSPAAQAALAAAPKLIETVLTGGDDYEIVCTVPPQQLEQFRELARDAEVPVTAIGCIAAGKAPPRFRDARGNPFSFVRGSFSHF